MIKKMKNTIAAYAVMFFLLIVFLYKPIPHASAKSAIPKVVSGIRHTVGLKSDGMVVAKGLNQHGQCNVSSWRDIVQIAAGGYFTVGLKSDGTVVATGSNLFGQLNISSWTNIIQVAASKYNTVGLKSDGSVMAVGSNRFGRLNIGEIMSPPLIRAVKGYINPSRDVIIDAPPGTSCPVIEAVKETDFCILVSEPTPFGLNDLILAVQVLKKLRIPFGVIINRSDIGDNKLDDYCKRESIEILMRIPFKKEIAVAYSKGIPLVDTNPVFKERLNKLYEDIKKCRI